MLEVVARRKINNSEVKRILVRVTNWVGDVVMTLPSLEAINENFPKSSVTVIARDWVLPLLENHPAVDHIIPLRKSGRALLRIDETMRVVTTLRKEQFDLAVLFQNAFEAALIAYLGGAKFRVGYNTDGRGFLLTHRVVVDEEVLGVHQVEYYLGLLKAMGWKAQTRDPALFVDQDLSARALSLMVKKGIRHEDFLLGLGPGAIFGNAKRWPPERFAKLGDWAIERWGARVIVFGSEKEAGICGELCRSMSHEPINLCGGTTLGEAMAVISRCKCFVTNDSGLMHVAAALGVPTVAVFGSTNPVTTGPRGRGTRVVRHPVPCAPCLRAECPEDHLCMRAIQPQEVWEQMADLRREME